MSTLHNRNMCTRDRMGHVTICVYCAHLGARLHRQLSIIFKRKPNKSISRPIAGSHLASQTTFFGRCHPRANLKMNSLYLAAKRTPSPRKPLNPLLSCGPALAHLPTSNSAALARLPPLRHRAFQTLHRAYSRTTHRLWMCTRV